MHTYSPSTGPRLKEGEITWVQGHEFIVTNVRYSRDPEFTGYEIMRYNGVCTNHACNNSIRDGGYNGGCYGYRVKAQ